MPSGERGLIKSEPLFPARPQDASNGCWVLYALAKWSLAASIHPHESVSFGSLVRLVRRKQDL